MPKREDSAKLQGIWMAYWILLSSLDQEGWTKSRQKAGQKDGQGVNSLYASRAKVCKLPPLAHFQDG